MYSVKFFKGNYSERQKAANDAKCIAYIEHHFNSAEFPKANYAMVVVSLNSSPKSRDWGRDYVRRIVEEFGVGSGGDGGLVIGGFDGRGDRNLNKTKMPAILVEPLFGSNSAHADWIRSDEGQMRLARVLTNSIQHAFPEGGLIGFSVGHKYKISRPNDRGADVVGGGTEADCAEQVLLKAQKLLEALSSPTVRKIRIFSGSDMLYEIAVDKNTVTSWNPEEDILRIS